MAVATEIDPNGDYICVMSHCNPNMIGEVVVLEQEFKGSDPVVQAAPSLFMPKGTPKQSWPHDEAYAIATNDQRSAELTEARKAAFERQAKANAVKLEQPRYVFLKKEYVGEFEGAPATLKRGSALPETHPFVVANRSLFGSRG